MLVSDYVRVRAAAIAIAAVFASPLTPLLVAQAPAPAPAKAPAATRAAAPAAAAGEHDGGWPRSYTTPSGAALVIYQPQVASWTDQKKAVMYAAVSYTPKGGKPALGTTRVESDTSVALDERLVSFSDYRIIESNFPTLPREQVKTVVQEITSTVPLNERVIALERVLAHVDTSMIIPKNVEGVKADPPTIFYSATPAVLVNIDGEPIWSPIPENDLRTAVNTNWDLFEHVPSKTFYLRNGGTWLKASDVKGPWGAAGTLPDSFKKLPDDENWKEVKVNLSGGKVSASQLPKVFVSLEPAELILLTGGKPSYLLVQGTKQLLWVNNTENDIFRLGQTGPVYFLVAGRWFSAPDFTGPWTFATPTLPAEFKQIPLEHQRSRVLASVPGTTQAAEAILLAQVPQTARVTKTLEAPEVVYQGGAPEFQPIETTSVQRAVNTDKDILKIGDLYYMCFQGVWFMSKTATGPWSVTGEVPKQVYEIPVSSPSHAVTYVTVEDDDDDAVVFATAAAYTGVMIAWGCAVWGTGYYYPPYVGYGGYYPYYRPVLSDLRVWRVVQPLDWGLHSRCGGVRSLRRGRRRPALQPQDRHLLARCRRLGTLRRAWCRERLQPAHRRSGRDPAGLERVWELGPDGRGARRRLGHHVAIHEQHHRQHDSRHQDERWRRLCRPRRQRLPEGGRQLPEVRRRRLEHCRAADRGRRTGSGSVGARRRRGGRPRGRGRVGLEHGGAGDARFLSAGRGCAAHARLEPDAQRGRHALSDGQLPRGRRSTRRRAAPLIGCAS